jgi:hypothetical protein
MLNIPPSNPSLQGRRMRTHNPIIYSPRTKENRPSTYTTVYPSIVTLIIPTKPILRVFAFMPIRIPDFILRSQSRDRSSPWGSDPLLSSTRVRVRGQSPNADADADVDAEPDRPLVGNSTRPAQLFLVLVLKSASNALACTPSNTCPGQYPYSQQIVLKKTFRALTARSSTSHSRDLIPFKTSTTTPSLSLSSPLTFPSIVWGCCPP